MYPNIPNRTSLSPEQLKVWKSALDFYNDANKVYHINILRGIPAKNEFVMPHEETLNNLQRFAWRNLKTALYSKPWVVDRLYRN